MQSTTSSHQELGIGSRISLNGNKGTTKYIGEVQGTQGVWLGVEWDNPLRGKHNGEKDGKQYFACSVPGSGSFIRSSPAISYGQSFVSALISKYVELPHSNGLKETVILGSSNGAIEVEAIGLDKVRGKLSKLECLREISLDGADIAYANLPGEIGKSCPNVRSLDLSSTLLGSWDAVACITKEIPALRELSLNRNRLSKIVDTNRYRSAFLSLEELRINETMTTWPEVICLVSVMPSLRVLEVGYNGMEQLGGVACQNDLPETGLEVLNLDENKLLDWDDTMQSISLFRKLDRLILTANQFQRIPAPPTSQGVLLNVEYLGLQDNLISEWRDVDALNVWLPNLKTLNMSGNPIFSRLTDFRQQVIARLPKLQVLNGTLVTIKERTDSEIYYLSQISRNSQIPAEAREDEFPRWKELCEKHGAPEDKGTVKARDTLADRLISIYVHLCKSAEPDLHVKVVASSAKAFMAQVPPPSTLRVLPTMPIRLLGPKLMKGLKLLSNQSHQGLSIWLAMEDDGLRKIGPKDDARDLAWWGLQDGSHIIIILTTQTDHKVSDDDRNE